MIEELKRLLKLNRVLAQNLRACRDDKHHMTQQLQSAERRLSAFKERVHDREVLLKNMAALVQAGPGVPLEESLSAGPEGSVAAGGMVPGMASPVVDAAKAQWSTSEGAAVLSTLPPQLAAGSPASGSFRLKGRGRLSAAGPSRGVAATPSAHAGSLRRPASAAPGMRHRTSKGVRTPLPGGAPSLAPASKILSPERRATATAAAAATAYGTVPTPSSAAGRARSLARLPPAGMFGAPGAALRKRSSTVSSASRLEGWHNDGDAEPRALGAQGTRPGRLRTSWLPNTDVAAAAASPAASRRQQPPSMTRPPRQSRRTQSFSASAGLPQRDPADVDRLSRTMSYAKPATQHHQPAAHQHYGGTSTAHMHTFTPMSAASSGWGADLGMTTDTEEDTDSDSGDDVVGMPALRPGASGLIVSGTGSYSAGCS